jgi:preprotein translocase subunit SecA
MEMDYLREGIHLRGIAQTDPLVAWQREGYEMFGHLMDAIDDDFVRFINHVQLVNEQEAAPDYSQANFAAAAEPVQELGGIQASTPSGAVEAPARVAAPGALANAIRPSNVSQTIPKVGRNDPCPCGSGKKYKLCHGAN